MKLFRNKFAVIWLFGLTISSCFLIFTGLGGGEATIRQFNTIVFDTYQRLKPRQWGGNDIVIVDIDETSIRRLGQWPWPRTTIAELTDRLGNLGAAAVVFDIVFSEPDRTSPMLALDSLRRAGAQIQLPSKLDMLNNDLALAESFKRNLVVSGLVLQGSGVTEPPAPKAGTGLSGTFPPHLMKVNVKAIRNLEIFDDAAAGIGQFGFETEIQTDGVVRDVKPLTEANGYYYPSLSFETLRVVQGAGGFNLKSSDASGEYSGGQLNLVSARVGALEVPTDANGAMRIYHSAASSKPTLPVRAVLFPQESGISQEQLAADIANHIVLIGTSAEGLLDLRATPLQPVVPGVTIHADIIDQIIAGAFISRPDTAKGIELAMALMAVLLLLVALPLLNPLGDALSAASLIAAVTFGFWYMFSNYQMLFSPVIPVAAILLAYMTGVATDLLITERQGKFVRNAFAYYLSPAMVDRLADNPEALKLGGEEKELTILFCDIRGFTSLSEGLDPTELTELLNNFLTPMTTALLEKGATIDKYMGDAIMAFWNAPIDQEDHAQLACEGLLEMRRELVALNQRAPRAIDIGIGLNTGPCCVGNLGSNQRFNYSAIGDAVNVSSRIEGLTKQYGLDNLVAEETLSRCEGFASLEVDSVAVVGREEPLTVHFLLGSEKAANDTAFERLREVHQEMIDSYRAGDVEQGLSAMAQAGRLADKLTGELGDVSLLKLYAVYAERFALLRENGVPHDWDGVFRATSK